MITILELSLRFSIYRHNIILKFCLETYFIYKLVNWYLASLEQTIESTNSKWNKFDTTWMLNLFNLRRLTGMCSCRLTQGWVDFGSFNAIIDQT